MRYLRTVEGTTMRLPTLAVGTALFATLSMSGCGGDSPRPASSDSYAAGLLTTPRLFGPGGISTRAPEFATSFSPDGETVYFNRTSEDRSQIRILSR